jgi:hypothetical protein
MKKIILFCLLIVYVWLLPRVFGQVSAASLKFDKTSASIDVGGTLSLSIIVDAGGEEISSTDIYVTYDASLIEAQVVNNGSFFPTVTNNITPGRVYIAGMVDDPASSKTGSGTVATVNFKGLKDGSVTISFDCNTSKIVKSDINATNILQCSSSDRVVVSVGSGGSSDPTPTPISQQKDLPKSGIFDNLINLAIPGGILFLIGSGLKLLILK